MEQGNEQPYRFKIEAHNASGNVLVELFKDGEPKPLGVRSVPQNPEDTFPLRLTDAKAWIAWFAGITRYEVRNE